MFVCLVHTLHLLKTTQNLNCRDHFIVGVGQALRGVGKRRNRKKNEASRGRKGTHASVSRERYTKWETDYSGAAYIALGNCLGATSYKKQPERHVYQVCDQTRAYKKELSGDE